MATKVQKTKIKREKGYLYFIDKDGDVAKVKAKRGGSKKKKSAPKKAAKKSAPKKKSAAKKAAKKR